MMRKHTPAILAAAAGMIFTTAAFAQETGGQSDQQGQGQGQSQPGEGQGQGQGRGQGRGADMQINQQIQKFAEDPGTAADKLFVVMAAIDNEFEIQSAQAAQQKSQNDQVKQVAQKMVDDHTKAKQQLQQVAQQLQVQLPEQLPRMKQATLQVMNALPADQFDKHYMAHLQSQHARDVTKFNATAQLSQNDQVKQFAQQQLPVLQQHFAHVNQTAQALGLPSGMEAVQAGAKIQGDSSGHGAHGTSGSGSSGSGSGSSGSGSGGSGASGSGAGGSSGSSGSGGAGQSQ
jgi:putative membrane protein